MLVPPSYAGALRRLLLTASVKSAPVPRAGAATRFSLALPIRAFSVSTRSAFPAAAAKKTKPAATKRATTATKKTATPSKRTAITKKTTKSSAKTTQAKKKPKKKTATAVKPPKKKKTLSPEEKDLATRRDLKKSLIKGPELPPTRIWNIFCAQEMAGRGGTKVTDMVKEIAAKYKSLDATEIERLNDIAEKNKVANKTKHKAWVEKHSVEEIKAHNLARTRLSKKWNFNTSLPAIKDHRVPKRPGSAYVHYSLSRWASGDMTGLTIGEAGKRLSGEWKAMSEAQKQPYVDQAEAAHAQWEKETSKLAA